MRAPDFTSPARRAVLRGQRQRDSVPLDNHNPRRRGWVRRLGFLRAAWPCQTGGRAKGRLRQHCLDVRIIRKTTEVTQL